MNSNYLSTILKKENNNLNFVRLWLAFSVIVGHTPAFISNTLPPSILNRFFPFTYCGNIAVVTFFFFSGLFVANSLFEKQSIKNYLISRFLRIYPALLFVLIISTSISYFFSKLNLYEYIQPAIRYIQHNFFMGYYPTIDSEISTVSFLRDGYPLDGKYATYINGSLWILVYEIRCYLMLLGLFLLCKCFEKYDKIILTSFCICGILSSIIFSEPLLGDNKELLYIIPAFSFGALLALYKDKIYFDWKMPFSLFLIGFIFNEHLTGHLFLFLGINSFCLWVSTLKYIKLIPIKIDISYGVYMWGWFVQQIVQYYTYNNVSYYSYVSICIILSVVMGILTYFFAEKPCLKIKKIIERKIICN